MSVALSVPIQDEADAQNVKLFVCLPCYNEAENLPQLLQQIHSTLTLRPQSGVAERRFFGVDNYRILAVDDGSTDRTEELLRDYARTYPLAVIRHRHNQGLAETYRTLIKTLKNQADPDDIAVFMDADNTHSPQVMIDLVYIASTTADVVIASRYTEEGAEVGVPLRRRLLSKVVNWLIRTLCGISIRDCTCGYRAYRAEVLKQLPPLESTGFEVSAEVLVGIARHTPKYDTAEVPFVLQYDRKKGASKIHIGQTIRAYVTLLWKYSKIDLTPFVRRVAYRISRTLGKTYDKDPVFWNDGMIALAFLIVSFFIYDSLTHALPRTLRLLGYVSIAFVGFCIQHFLRRFWIFQE